MEEEKRSFSWSGLLIKIILVVIFIIFTVWLLSLSTKDLSNSLDVLTDDIFSENIEKMKEAGREYFTKDKLPSKNNGIEILTLEEMYEKKLVLEIKDKNGQACSKENSYVSVEKFENEYQMKVYLECGEQKDHIIVTISCSEYGTCPNEDNTTNNNDNKNENDKNNNNNNNDNNNNDNKNENDNKEEQKIEYEYKKDTDGSWSAWGDWSDWSRVEISKLENRDVETKVEKEYYTYNEYVTTKDYVDFSKDCPTGYRLNQDKTGCYKIITLEEDPICSDKTNLVSQNGFVCNYLQTEETALSCPEGYEQIGNVCMTTVSTLEKETANPVCPQLEGYLTTNRDGFTCTYTKYTKGERLETLTGETIPANDENYIYEEVGNPKYQLDLNDYTFKWIHTYAVYKAIVVTETGDAKCPAHYIPSGNTCERSWLVTDTLEEELTCPIRDGFTLVQNNNSCSYTKEYTQRATCPTDYTENNNKCIGITTTNKEYNKECPTGYTLTKDGTKCEKPVTKTVSKVASREVKYYRYRLREYVNGTPLYEWSSSKTDKKLLDAGYKLTGRTR